MVGCKVSELEDILGVSRQAIYDKLKQDKYRGYVSRIKGIKVVSPEGVKALKLEYGIEINCKEIKEESDLTLKLDCKENQDFKEGHKDFRQDSKEFKVDFQENQEVIKELKERIKSLERDKENLMNLLQQQNEVIQQQNNLIQNEQQITLNHTELLLVEKREVLRLRQEQHQMIKKTKGIKGIVKRWLDIS